jgi:hypothetical protein
MEQFKVGDVVKWTSQASGVSKEKQGEIVCFVPANTEVPGEYKARNFSRLSRNYDSYIVKIKGQFFRPLPKYLTLVSRAKSAA